MTPYHGTPIGGSRQDAARFLIGRNALVPYPRQDDIGIVADVCQRARRCGPDGCSVACPRR